MPIYVRLVSVKPRLDVFVHPTDLGVTASTSLSSVWKHTFLSPFRPLNATRSPRMFPSQHGSLFVYPWIRAALVLGVQEGMQTGSCEGRISLAIKQIFTLHPCIETQHMARAIFTVEPAACAWASSLIKCLLWTGHLPLRNYKNKTPWFWREKWIPLSGSDTPPGKTEEMVLVCVPSTHMHMYIHTKSHNTHMHTHL